MDYPDRLHETINKHITSAYKISQEIIDEYIKSAISFDDLQESLLTHYNTDYLEILLVFQAHIDLFTSSEEKIKATNYIKHCLLDCYCLNMRDDEPVFNEELFNVRKTTKTDRMNTVYKQNYSSDSKNEKDDEVDKYIMKFSNTHIREWCKDELRGFFRYLLQDKVTDIPYNFLIQADTEDASSKFTDILIKVIGEIRSKTCSVLYKTEHAVLSKPTPEDWDDNDILLIYRCLDQNKYYPIDDDSPQDKAEKNNYSTHWDLLMDFYEKEKYRNSGKIVLLTATPKIVNDRIRNNQRMFYRFFRHHIVIGNMDEDEIFDAVKKQLNTVTNDHSYDFDEKLRDYINTVYPKADLKNEEFVRDLYIRITSQSFLKDENCNLFSNNSIPFYHVNESFSTIDNEFKSLVGLESVKDTFVDIGRLCQNLQNSNNKPYLHMVFKGNPGTGKTTVAKYIAKMLCSMRVIKKNQVIEVMTSDLLGQYTGQTAPKVENILERASGGVLVIDEAYLLNPETAGSYTQTYREECIGILIKAMEKKCDPIIVFAGYPKQMDDLIKSNPGLASRIGYIINFDDYNDEQLLEIFKSMCEKNGYPFDDEAISAVNKKISALKYEDNFGNARTVENIFNQAVSECLRDNSTEKIIRAKHIIIDKNIKSLNELQDKLNSLVGIANAKEVISEQIMSNKFCKEKGKILPTSNNMVFVGNAGTGKTTTAKIFAEMLFSIGAAKSPRTKMITAKDLYVQDVAKRLNDICNETMGGVLFIDEIYLLNRFPSTCSEVVSVLLELLENRKEDLTVILAGYEKQIDEFLNDNQGLKSRFPITVHFDDFTEDELCDIFSNDCNIGGMEVNDEALSRFREIIHYEMKKDNFGNGRTVRNIYEQAFRRHATNYYENENLDPDVISKDDLDFPVEVNAHDKKRHIGFNQ